MPVQEMISPPRTIMEVFTMLPEGTLAEVIENSLYMSPTPSKDHQRILRKLLTQLDLFVTRNDAGEVFCAPLDVFLDENANAVQPDLMFISKENSWIIDEFQTVHGVPDLIIEILSPGNRNHDTVIKKNLYEKFGVEEYWIIDPETKKATGFALTDGAYTLIGEYNGSIHCRLLRNDFTY
jgi:Uma2 family endonuclease